MTGTEIGIEIKTGTGTEGSAESLESADGGLGHPRREAVGDPVRAVATFPAAIEKILCVCTAGGVTPPAAVERLQTAIGGGRGNPDPIGALPVVPTGEVIPGRGGETLGSDARDRVGVVRCGEDRGGECREDGQPGGRGEVGGGLPVCRVTGPERSGGWRLWWRRMRWKKTRRRSRNR